MSSSTLLLFQPLAMSPAQLAAVSYLARYSGRTHYLYAFRPRRWFSWCEANGLDPLVGIQPAHVELHIRHLGDCGLMDSSIPARHADPRTTEHYDRARGNLDRFLTAYVAGV
jgi:hypothetical protein